MDQVIVAFVGVLVGAVVTAGANYALVARRERAEAAKDRLSRANELKTAARLISNDFSTAQEAATVFVENKRWVPGTARNFPLDAWQRDKEILARELPLEDWNAVEKAALAVEHFRTIAPVLRVSDDMAEADKRLLRDITTGLESLLPYM